MRARGEFFDVFEFCLRTANEVGTERYLGTVLLCQSHHVIQTFGGTETFLGKRQILRNTEHDGVRELGGFNVEFS